MPSKLSGVTGAVACLASAVAIASPAGGMAWVSVCTNGYAHMRLLPLDPDEPGRQDRPYSSACHAPMLAQRKLLTRLPGKDAA